MGVKTSEQLTVSSGQSSADNRGTDSGLSGYGEWVEVATSGQPGSSRHRVVDLEGREVEPGNMGPRLWQADGAS